MLTQNVSKESEHSTWPALSAHYSIGCFKNEIEFEKGWHTCEALEGEAPLQPTHAVPDIHSQDARSRRHDEVKILSPLWVRLVHLLAGLLFLCVIPGWVVQAEADKRIHVALLVGGLVNRTGIRTGI